MTDYLLSLAVQISVLMLMALASAAALRRRSAALRHWVLSVAFVCAACLPILQGLMPDWVLDVGQRMSVTQASPASPTSSSSEPWRGSGTAAARPVPAPADHTPRWPVSFARLIPTVWAVGATAWFALLAAGLVRLAWLAGRAQPLTHPTCVRIADDVARGLGVRRRVELLQTDRPAIVVAWGWARPHIMVPRSAAQWPVDDIDVVLRHEMAHIARGDWIVQLVAETLRAVNWFNPLLWIAVQRLRSESERACDDVVLARGVGGSDYAARLVALARTLNAQYRWSSTLPAPSMARPSSLERRVAAMLNTKLSRAPLTTATRVAIACLAVAVTLPLAGLAVLAQAPTSFMGSVLDPTNRNVPNARVVLTNVQTQVKQEVVSDSEGRFEFVALPAGNYALEATLPGFATLKGTVAVTASGLQRNLNLQIGSVQETIRILVTAEPRAQTGAVPESPAAPARAVHPRSPAPCTPSPTTGGNIVPPIKLRDVKPEYPEHLKADKVAGLVVVEGVLGKDGTVRELRVVEAPHPDLGWAVMEAVGRWAFDATLLNCDPVDVKIRVNARFEF